MRAKGIRRRLVWLWAAGVLLGVSVGAFSQNNADMFWPGSYREPLSPSQRQWLNDLPRPARIGVTAIPPQVFYSAQNGQLSGLCVDYIHHIEQILGYRFEVIFYDTWQDLMSAAIDRQVDMIYAAQRTPSREKYFLFSRPYLKFNNVIVAAEQFDRPLRLNDLNGKQVAVVRGAALEEYLKTQFPRIALQPVADEMAGLSRVSFGHADAMVVEIARASWYIRQNKFTNLYIVGDAEYPFELGFACRNDWPQLVEIINAALAHIPAETHRALLDRWLLPEPPTYRQIKRLMIALAVVAAVAAGVLMWNRLLHRTVRQRTQQLGAELKAHQIDAAQLRRYETIVSLSADMMAYVDRDGFFQAVNDAYLNALNKPRAALLGKPSKEFFDPAFYAASVAPRVEQALAGQTVRFQEWRDFAGIGRRFISGVYYPSRDAGGNIDGIAIVLHDETEKQMAFQRLQESQDRLSSIIAAAPVGIGVLYQDLLASVNKLVCLNTGYEETELLGRSISALFASLPEADRALNDIRDQIQRGGIGSVETRWLRKDGRLIDVALSIVPIDPADPSKGQTFAAMDITDRKAAQAALEESRQAMERLINNLRGIMYRCQFTPDWPMEYISQGCLEMTGYADSEFISGQIHWGQLIPPEDNKRIFRQIAQAVAAKEPYTIEYPIIDRQGKQRWFWEKGCAVYDAQGNAVALEGFITDLTDRKQAELALQESEQKFRQLFENAFLAVAMHQLVCDDAGRPADYIFLDVNPAFERQVGLKADQIIGKRVREVFNSPDIDWFIQTYGDVALRKTSTTFERYFEGLQKHFAVCAYPLSDLRFATVFDDITQRKRAEQQLMENAQKMQRLVNEISQKNQELQNIVYIASHDLRSPLVNVRGFAGELEKSLAELTGLLEAADLPADQRSRILALVKKDIPEALAFIKKGSVKMDQLLNGLARLSRIGSAPLSPRRLDMSAILRDALANKQYALRQHEVDIAVEGDLPACLGDPILVSQVFENLIDNAVKFRHPQRPCRIRIRGQRDQSRCRYDVQDNGIGIAPEHRQKVFEIFHQLDPTVGGDGLGLTIVRRILDRQDGQIEIADTPGGGTTISVWLPAADA